MFAEAAEAPHAVARQLDRNRAFARGFGARLRTKPPRAVVTCARGSSDHAATFAKYLVETRAGVLCSSAAPSIASVYGASQDLSEVLFVAISQSGRSPDLVATAQAARRAGATVVAVVNAEASPLAQAAHSHWPLHAGAEDSVAATKSFIASLAALVHLVAEWRGDDALLARLAALPAQLERAWSLDWSPALGVLRDAHHAFVIARGLGLGVAQEAALKCKETCALHAEAFSSAEVAHGPQALLGPGFPALLLAQDDETRAGVAAQAAALAARGVPVLLAGATAEGATTLPTLAADPVLQPLLLAQSFYRLANALAIARGRDPDRPPHLSKVTSTL
ncbi:MAG TPA: SIS domain-containing protein [Xanthomonadales bacterium]|nr:SIS domain-containing protein [Xanthomonadales bacterium]